MSSKTVDEAQLLGCPHFRGACRADKCMMWRWKYDKVHIMEMQANEFFEKGFVAVSTSSGNGIPMVNMIRNQRRGYCGLASEPEI